jgi:hypothetical protein
VPSNTVLNKEAWPEDVRAAAQQTHQDDIELLLARTLARGLVLLSEYSPQSIAGTIFFRALRKGANTITDNIPLSTFRVDNL